MSPIVNGNDDMCNDIVITGISGRLPECNTIEEFKQKLLDGEDLVTDDGKRWKSGIFGLPVRTGKIKDLASFDAAFFEVHGKQADKMDPQLRLLLEITYEAIVDAGLNLNEIRDTKTGVFIGTSSNEAWDYWNQDPEGISGYGLIGCTRSMLANRLSYFFDINGPSYVIDTACSGSLAAFQEAVIAIKTGRCDSAIVGGVNVFLNPASSVHFLKLNMLSPDGKSKVFDHSADGYVRSEAVVAVLLQKAKLSKRIYATVLGTKTNIDGYKEGGITYPSGDKQYQLVHELYNEINIKPEEVAYLECHGTGTKVGDPEETNAMAEIFCKNRKNPLLIGSVKSNMGHSEPASGLCSIVKVLIAMETEIIPRNLHFKTPNSNIPGLYDGRLRVVTENEPWKGGIVGINNFGFGGYNAHVVLRSNFKSKVLRPAGPIPKLVGVSGRTEESVNIFLKKIEQHKNDDELFALINEIHRKRIKGHNYRGYAIFKDKILKEVVQVPGGSRQIVFIYSGMGSQWAGMAKDLMKFESFRNSIKICADVLKPYEINLENIIVNGPQDVFNNILHSFIAITAMQIGLTDLIKTLGIEPDFLVGHSVGELGCAYADGAFTAEQTILASYFRGRAIVDSTLPPGAMAAVGLSWADVKKRCPPNVFPVCNNCEDNVTISGDRESIEKLVAQFQSEGIFCKIVASSGYAFHCNYIKECAPVLRKSLDRIIPNTKRRSSKWISSSVPESEWNTPLAQYNSAAYHINNLLSPVLFYDALKHLPENVITIEIAPTGLLQAILKRALNPPTTNISLVKRGYPDNVEFLLSAIGKIFTAGGQPCFDKLYSPVSFPVSRGTPMINSMIEWDHCTKWTIPLFSTESSLSGQLAVNIDINNESYAFLAGHKIDGRIVFPATGYLILVWSAIAKFRHAEYKDLPIIMENVEFRKEIVMPLEGSVKFLVNVFETGSFEVSKGGSVVVSGHFTIPEVTSKEVLNLPIPIINSQQEHLPLTKSDIYKELRLRGYDYSGVFMGITESDNYGVVGKLTWDQNWISFIDTMLQFYLIDQNTRELLLPTRIQRIVIDPKNHLQIVKALPTDDTVPVYVHRKIEVISSGGIEIRGPTASSTQRRPHANAAPILEKYVFIPYENQQPFNEDSGKNKIHILTVISQIVLENKSDNAKLKIVEIGDGRSVDLLISPIIKRIYQSEPKVITEVSIVTSALIDASILQDNEINYAIKDVTAVPVSQNAHLVILSDVLKHTRKNILENAVVSIKMGMFLLIEEEYEHADISKLCDFEVVSKFHDHKKVYLLLRKQINIPTDATVIQVNDKNFSWVEPLKEAMKLAEADTRRIYLISQGDNYSGILGMINCLKKEPGGSNVRAVLIQDSNASKFSIPVYENQLRKDFLHNVFQNKKWGSFRHLPLEHYEENCTVDVEHAYVNALYRGDLSSLRWIEGPLKYYKNQSPDVELCSVYYSGLNFRDFMHASGKLPAVALPDKITGAECILGTEFSGRNSVGKRVMGIVGAKSLATTVLSDPGFSWAVPDNWSLEEAATVPVVYVTGYYSLIIRGRLEPGESVLIHAGTGGVGQAAIAIALHMGCTVFTTVSNQVKRDFLKQKFAQLRYENIGNSRDSSFEQMIMMETNGRGVDVVLNSFASPLLQASLRCLAVGGRFLEIGKIDFVKNSLLGMGIFLKNRTFHGIVLDEIALSSGNVKRKLCNLFNDGIKNGTITPLPRTVFNEHQVEEAFRYMATGKHIGKVLLKIRDEENLVTKSVSKKVRSIPRTYMDPTKSYILVGGMGGFGLELANWLITRGAQNIILNSRSGVKTGYQSLCIRKWTQKGINVLISTNDAATQEGARRLLEESIKLGPVGGIFNLAAVLRDGLLENLTAGDFEISCRPKIICSKNLDIVSRDMAPNLEYFVNFSSVSCGRGNPGQTNYGWANSALERLVESRQGAGLPGKAIQFGAIGEVGLLLETTGKTETEIEGTLTQKIASCLSTLDFFLCLPDPILTSMVIADKHKKVSEEGQVSIMQAMANILGIKDLKNLDLRASLIQIGMDSLMSTEIKQALERNYDIVMSEQEIRKLTFGQLAKITKSGETVPVHTTCA